MFRFQKGDESLNNASTKKAGFLSRHKDGSADLKMPERAKKILQKKGVRIFADYFFVSLSFIIPFVLMAIAFAALNIHGFASDGDQQALVVDGWHQYFPFLQEMQDKMKSGGSLLYTLRSGLGSNFLAVLSYYTASPLNFFTVFIPAEYLRDVFALFICLKVGCAGLFMSLFLRGTFKRNDFSIVLFSIPYALSAYMMGYYWNIMWLDTVALAPLVFLGTFALVREGRYKTYVIGLAIAFFSNFYIGFFVCVFVAMMFFAVNIILRPTFKMFLKRLGQIALYTVVALGITAVLILPAYIALQHAYSANSTFPSTFRFYDTFTNVISNTLAFGTPSTKEGLPNLYSGLLAMIMLGTMLFCNKISIREKIVYIIIVGFLIVSCNYNVLDYIWNGFHVTNMIPFRFSFLFVFAVLAIGYRAFTKLDRANWIMLLGGIAVFAILLYIANAAGIDKSAYRSNIFLGVGYLICLALVAFRFLNTKAIAFVMLFPMIFELNANVKAGTQAVGSSSYETYYSNGEGVKKLVDEYGSDNDDFYRMETSKEYTINDPALYQYRGVSMFSSMLNCQTTQYTRNLGIMASRAGNRYYYRMTTPFTNAVLNLKYTIMKTGDMADTKYNKLVATENNVKLYENQAYLPLGFMCEDGIENMDVISSIPFYYQNQLFKAMTGIDKNIFYYVPMTSTDGCRNLEVTSKEKNTGFHTYEPKKDTGYKNIFSGKKPLNNTDKDVDGVKANTQFQITPDSLSGASGKTMQVTFEYMDDKSVWSKGANIEFFAPSDPNNRRTINGFEFVEGKSVMFPVELNNDVLKSGLVIEGFGVRITNVSLVGTTSDTAANTNQNGTVSLKYTASKPGWYYGCFKFEEIESINITTTNQKNPVQTLGLKSTMPYACQIGYLDEGDSVTVTGTTKDKLTSKSTFLSCVYRLDDEVFDDGLSKLKSNGTLDVTSVSDTDIKGKIKVNNSGIMYTSIPYEKGWSVYVNGEKQNAIAVCNNTYNETGVKTHDGSMLGIRLDKGEYEIELKYSPEGFTAGIVISLISLAAFIALIIYNRRRAKSGKVVYDMILSPEERKEQGIDVRSDSNSGDEKSDDDIDFSVKINKK